MDPFDTHPLHFEPCRSCASPVYNWVGERTEHGIWMRCANCGRITWRKHISANTRDVAWNEQEVKEKLDEIGKPTRDPAGFLRYPGTDLLVPTDVVFERMEREKERRGKRR